MAQEFKCNGDCLNCRKMPNERREQWQYCASQFTYNSMRMIGDIQESLKTMQGAVEELKEKIDAIQNSEAEIFNPAEEMNIGTSMSQTSETIAQSGDGAEE